MVDSTDDVIQAAATRRDLVRHLGRAGALRYRADAIDAGMDPLVPRAWHGLPAREQARRKLDHEATTIRQAGLWASSSDVAAVIARVAAKAIYLPLTVDLVPASRGFVWFPTAFDHKVSTFAWGEPLAESTGTEVTIWIDVDTLPIRMSRSARHATHGPLVYEGGAVLPHLPLVKRALADNADSTDRDVGVWRSIVAWWIGVTHGVFTVRQESVKGGSVSRVAVDGTTDEAVDGIVAAAQTLWRENSASHGDVVDPLVDPDAHGAPAMRHDPVMDLSACDPDNRLGKNVVQVHHQVTDMTAHAIGMINDRYPEIWGVLDEQRRARGDSASPGWPQWCHIPHHEVFGALYAYDPHVPLEHAMVVAALAAWRYTRHAVYPCWSTDEFADIARPCPTDLAQRLAVPAVVVAWPDNDHCALISTTTDLTTHQPRLHVVYIPANVTSVEDIASRIWDVPLASGPLDAAIWSTIYTSVAAQRPPEVVYAVENAARYVSCLEHLDSDDTVMIEGGHVLQQRPNTPWPTHTVTPHDTLTLWVATERANITPA